MDRMNRHHQAQVNDPVAMYTQLEHNILDAHVPPPEFDGILEALSKALPKKCIEQFRISELKQLIEARKSLHEYCIQALDDVLVSEVDESVIARLQQNIERIEKKEIRNPTSAINKNKSCL